MTPRAATTAKNSNAKSKRKRAPGGSRTVSPGLFARARAGRVGRAWTMPWPAGILGPEPRDGQADGGRRLRALLSVATRDGITAFARELQALGGDIFATDGTREHLLAPGIAVAAVSDLTGIPALPGGQVQQFHPG